jgi:uncharacterized membrane protein
MKRIAIPIAILLIGLLFSPILRTQAQSTLPVVRAVLFYSPTCGHCEFVINQTLIPMTNQYGNQLQILGVDISQQQGYELFAAALQKFGLDRGGVPFLVIDNIYLVGSADIPERFPALVETYLQNGDVDWPDIPGLIDFLPAPTESTPLPATPEPGAADMARLENLTWRERFALDPAGNTLAVFVLVGMIGAVGWSIHLFQKTKGASLKDKRSWVIPLLCVVGLGVAGYLAYVETTQVEAVCGPVGDCNTVQQSEYARLFGILPIGVLGLIGYAGILLAWSVARFADGHPSNLATIALFGMTVFGTLFSFYLTFLEPFVIGATCAWCLTSAVLMTTLMLLSMAPAKHALKKMRKR